MHTIRLRGPWRVRPLVAFEREDGRWTVVDLSPRAAETVVDLNRPWPETLAAVADAEFRGRLVWSRTFHAPTGLEEGTRVAISLQAPGATIAATLNGVPLELGAGADSAVRAGVRALLPSNELTVVVEAPWFPRLRDEEVAPATLATSLLGFEAALEIDDS